MTRVQINEGLKNKALVHSNDRLQYEYNRFGLSLERRKSMILIGTIGQLVFKHYLDKNNIEYTFEFQAGRYDQMDFSINNEIVEVKTSGFDIKGYKHLNLLYSNDQFQAGIAKNFKYCVQIFINGYNRSSKLLNLDKCTTAIIAGYIPFKDIENYISNRRFYGDDYKVPLSKLHKINKLINNGRKES